MEPIRNTVSSVIGRADAISARPWAWNASSRPPRTIPTASPTVGQRFRISVTAVARSVALPIATSPAERGAQARQGEPRAHRPEPGRRPAPGISALRPLPERDRHEVQGTADRPLLGIAVEGHADLAHTPGGEVDTEDVGIVLAIRVQLEASVEHGHRREQTQAKPA